MEYLKTYFTKFNFEQLFKWLDLNKNKISNERKNDLMLFKNRLSGIKKKLENVVNLLVDNPTDILKEKMKQLEKEKIELECYVNTLNSNSVESVNYKSIKKFIKEIENLENLERERQKNLIDTFIASIEINKKEGNYEIKISSNLSILLDIPNNSICQGDDGSPKGNRTPDTAVKGRCLNLLTMGPFEIM